MKKWLAVISALCLNVGIAQAQETMQTCSTIEWHASVLEQYPEIAADCQQIVETDGRYFAKLTANVIRVTPAGTVVVGVHTSDGDKRRRTFKPPKGMIIKTPNKELSWSELPRGYELNFYIPNDRFELASFADSENEADADAELAMAPSDMPKTASNQYLPLFGGIAMLFAAFSMMALRRRQ